MINTSNEAVLDDVIIDTLLGCWLISPRVIKMLSLNGII